MKKYRDHYFKRAKQENYPARSVYKLQEIDKRFRLLGPGKKVLDLGAAPGSWTLFAARKVGPSGRVLAADLQATETEFPANVTYLQADVTEQPSTFREALEAMGRVDLVISDMAPKTTGIKLRDQTLSFELCLTALSVAREALAPGGGFVAKNFEGPDTQEFAAELRRSFATVKRFKPRSSREESKEIFFVATGFRGAGQE